MATKKKMLQAAAGSAAGGGFTAIEDVFSTYLYTGNGSTQTITNGIDLDGEGGLIWQKNRTGAYSHSLVDTERGGENTLQTNGTDAQVDRGNDFVTSFNSDGFSIGADALINFNTYDFTSWTFRKAPRFFDVVTYTGNGNTQTIAHNLGSAPGCIIVKAVSGTSNWGVYHRGIGNTQFLSLNLTNAATTLNYWANTDPTDSEFTVFGYQAVNELGTQYVAYLYAHDPLGPSGDGSDGLIACGSYTGNASNSAGPVVDLGWEPQWVMIKAADSPYDWFICDTMRGWTGTHPKDDNILRANTSGAETANTEIGLLNSRGFQVMGGGAEINASGQNYIYIAIRRGPMRAPESGTEVFNVVKTSGVTSPTITTGFPTDLHLFKTTDVAQGTYWAARLTNRSLISSETSAETSVFNSFDSNTTVPTTVGSTGYAQYDFRRAPNFFDVVTYTGTGALTPIGHNLTVEPELIIFKRRNATQDWWVIHYDTDKSLRLNTTAAGTTADASIYGPVTATTFVPYLNTSGLTYIAYLFATLAGVSKVGSYTGTGTSGGNINVDCGFTAGARFVMIKRTDAVGSWFIVDTARGIVTGNEPILTLNEAGGELTNYNMVEPYSAGFIVNGSGVGSSVSWNDAGGNYIFYAIA